MSRLYLLDTDICVWTMRGREPVASRVRACSPDEIAISSMTEAELRYGVLKGNFLANSTLTEVFLAEIGPSLPFDSACASMHPHLRYATRAQRIGDHDLIIASVAIAHGLTLVSGNVREFSRVPGLTLENWTVA